MKYKDIPTIETDYYLIGSGIMSSTLGILLKSIYPNSDVTISEKLPDFGLESSAALNNAGTGHAGYCELNYTTESGDSIDISKAIKVNKAFSRSLEFWDYLIKSNLIKDDFMHKIPHYTFVHGEDNVNFLKKRFTEMSKQKEFQNIEFTSDIETLSNWFPLIMNGRLQSDKIAGTKASDGLDVDFGKLTNYYISLLQYLKVKVRTNSEVIDIYRSGKEWVVVEKKNNKLLKIKCKFVFIGAGGASINLLEKSGIPEGKHYGGFPVSGEWLICDNPEIVKQHNGKVYGKADIDAPPMSVPHLDKRIIDGKECLLFGPYAGLTTRFLKFGSRFDFFKSIRISNIRTLISACVSNMGLNKYLFKEVIKTYDKKFNVLTDYYPNANKSDWKLLTAGKRVQIIKNVGGKGVIEFGTEIVSSSDGTLACLLGASPGASTAVKIMVDVLNTCFELDTNAKQKISEMIPSYNEINN